MVPQSMPPGRPVAGMKPRGRGLLLSGVALTVLALVVGVTSGVFVASTMGVPLYESFSTPARQTPIDDEFSLRQGRYTIYQLTGDAGDLYPEGTGTSIGTADVQVVAPDGSIVPTRSLGSSRVTMTRGTAVYTGAVRFTTSESGTYRIRVSSAVPAQVVIAPALGSGFGAAVTWLLVGSVCVLAFALGLVLIIVGAIRRWRHRKSDSGSPPLPPDSSQPAPPPGWYSAPDTAGRERYWDGRSWTEHLR